MASSSNISRHTFKSECYSISFTQNQERPYFACSYTDRTIRIWDINQIMNLNKTLDEPAHVIKDAIELAPVDIKFDSQGTRLGATSMDGSIKVFDIKQNYENDSLTSKLVLDSNLLDQSAGDQPYDASNPDGSSITNVDPWKFMFNPKNGNQFITGQLGLQFVDINQQNLKVGTQIPHNKYINCMDFSKSGKLVATGDIDGAVKVYDTANFKMVGNQFNNHGRGVKCIQFTPDSREIISGSEDLHMHLCDIETQQRTLTLVNHADWITSISFNPIETKYFVSTSLDKTIKIWAKDVNKEVKTIELSDAVWSASFSPDGKYIVACCQNGQVNLISFVN